MSAHEALWVACAARVREGGSETRPCGAESIFGQAWVVAGFLLAAVAGSKSPHGRGEPCRGGSQTRPRGRFGTLAHASGIALVLAVVSGCEQPRMADQDKYEPYGAAPGWPGNQSARTPVAGTVARSDPIEPRPDQIPVPVTHELLERGRTQFEANCRPCHGRVGYGEGMIVQRGFPQPPSFHSEHLRAAPLTHFYDVITDGFGVMYSYAARVPPDDRWAVAAYIRALQLSQHAAPDDLTPAQRRQLEGGS